MSLCYKRIMKFIKFLFFLVIYSIFIACDSQDILIFEVVINERELPSFEKLYEDIAFNKHIKNIEMFPEIIKTIQIELDKERLRDYRLSSDDVIKSIINEYEKEILIKKENNIIIVNAKSINYDIDSFQHIIINSNESQIKLRDIALLKREVLFKPDNNNKVKIQVTYVKEGVKNLLDFTPRADAINNAHDPFSDEFDTTYVYTSNQGIRGFFGVTYIFR